MTNELVKTFTITSSLQPGQKANLFSLNRHRAVNVYNGKRQKPTADKSVTGFCHALFEDSNRRSHDLFKKIQDC